MHLYLFSIFTIVMMFFNAGLKAENLDITGQPTVGYPKATVQVVALLDPKCPDSKKYNNDVFAKLEGEFINTNKIRYTVIPVSFLVRSMPAAIALLCVYHQDAEYTNSDLFFTYLNYLFRAQPPESENWATAENLIKYAKDASPAIKTDHLKECIEKEQERAQIEKNTAYGNRLMEGKLSTPTLFVDGVKIENKDETVSWENLKSAIEKAIASHEAPPSS